MLIAKSIGFITPRGRDHFSFINQRKNCLRLKRDESSEWDTIDDEEPYDDISNGHLDFRLAGNR